MVQVTLLRLLAIVAKGTRLILNTAFSDDLARTGVCAGRPSVQSRSKCSLFLACYISGDRNYGRVNSTNGNSKKDIFLGKQKDRHSRSSNSNTLLIQTHRAGEARYRPEVLNEAVPPRHLVEGSLLTVGCVGREIYVDQN